MRIAALVTGGKDSVLALYRALKLGYEVKFLVTMIPQREDSWMFHFPNIHLTDLFAKAVQYLDNNTSPDLGLRGIGVHWIRRIARIDAFDNNEEVDRFADMVLGLSRGQSSNMDLRPC